ncbi:MAG: hypothetical protein ACRDPY_17550 [Streptosporangiaceae bacterium]
MRYRTLACTGIQVSPYALGAMMFGRGAAAFGRPCAMIDQLAAAYYELENDDDIRCGVLYGHGDHFTGGLGLAEVGPLVRDGRLDEAFSGPGRRDPWRKDNVWTTPLGVKTTLASAHRARIEGEAAAFARLDSYMAGLFGTEDGREGLTSFVERREARFVGR